MGEITYRFGNDIDLTSVVEVFRDSGIRRPIEESPRIREMLEHANLIVTAWDGERLVGIGRALTDFSYCCYLSDIAVRRQYQRQGIGTHIISVMRERLGDKVSIILLSAPEAMGYYPTVGFSPVDNGWIIRRQS